LDAEGRFDEAEKAYRAVLAEEPSNEAALLNLGRLYRRRGQFDEAIALYQGAVEASPDNLKLRNNLGVVYRLAQKYDLAEKTLRAVLTRSPGNVDAYKNMAVLFLDQDKLALAEQFSVEARKLDEKDAGIWNNLGLIHFKRDDGKPTRAMSAFRKAAELEPNDPTAHVNIGAIALKYRDYASAEKSFAAALALEGNDPEALLGYAFALDGGRKTTAALAAYDKVTGLLGKERCDVVWQQTLLFKSEKRWQEAFDKASRYKALACSDVAAEKVDQELKTADYMLKKASAPAPAPVVEEKKSAPTEAEPVKSEPVAVDPAKTEPAPEASLVVPPAAPVAPPVPEAAAVPASPVSGGEASASDAAAAP
ncbi:MAG: hypothetical protein RL199_793, partial [Pseudomonadota bacterium]